MTDKKTRVLSNLLSLVLGAGIGAGCCGEYKNRSVWCDVLKRVKGAEEWQERKREREY